MQFFELHFNPKRKEDQIFDSFCFEPENIYEKRLGSLFVIGELKNVLPQNLKFLDNLTNFLKREFYSSPIKFSQEAAFKKSLKESNQFLEEIAKRGNVNWLGNLNLAILSLSSSPAKKKYWEINLAKVGEIEILLLRHNQIIDIGKKLEFSDIEPYPLKIFSNIVSGKLIENDIVLVLTKMADSLRPEGFLLEIAKMSAFNEKEFRQILKKWEKNFLEISGICFLCYFKEKELGEKYHPIIFQPKLKKFSISQVFLPIFKGAKFLLKNLVPKNLILLRNLVPVVPFKFPKFKFSLSIPSLKNLILIALLLFFILTGFFLFRGEKIKEIQLAQEIIKQVQSKKIEAESFLILKNEGRANFLFQEAWKNILPQTKEGAPKRKEALLLKKEIEEHLFLLNKLEKISEPDLFFEFKQKETLIPQKILISKQNLYFFNPFSPKVYRLNLTDKSGNFLDAKKNLKSGAIFEDSALFFANPNILLFLKNDEFKEKIVQPILSEFRFNKLFIYRSNVYFLDTHSGKIGKYNLATFKKDTPLTGRSWLNPKTKKYPKDAISMTIDDSIWILTENKKIDRYAKGFYQETLEISLFPYLENPTKLWTSEKLPYFYLLEPHQNRLIILNKKGEIIKQFQSEKFDNLLGFAVSEDGKTIYLLNGFKVYRVNLF